VYGIRRDAWEFCRKSPVDNTAKQQYNDCVLLYRNIVSSLHGKSWPRVVVLVPLDLVMSLAIIIYM
jgi:hypothetical protein